MTGHGRHEQVLLQCLIPGRHSSPSRPGVARIIVHDDRKKPARATSGETRLPALDNGHNHQACTGQQQRTTGRWRITGTAEPRLVSTGYRRPDDRTIRITTTSNHSFEPPGRCRLWLQRGKRVIRYFIPTQQPSREKLNGWPIGENARNSCTDRQMTDSCLEPVAHRAVVMCTSLAARSWSKGW
jgi:hypothetical protein